MQRSLVPLGKVFIVKIALSINHHSESSMDTRNMSEVSNSLDAYLGPLSNSLDACLGPLSLISTHGILNLADGFHCWYDA